MGPSTPAAAQLFGVSGSSSNNVWAVGSGGTGLHYDGNQWSRSPTGTTQTLSAVWSDSPDDAWAVGSAGTVLRWSGKAWTR